MKSLIHAPQAASLLAAVGIATAANANQFIDLGGPATGFIALSNYKNSSSQSGIEGTANGLPEYPNYQMANGNYTAVIASPQSTTSDYSAFGSFGSGFSGTSFAIKNQTITQSDFATLSAGRIDFDNSLVTGVGTETIPASALSFDFNTFAWDGTVTTAQTGDLRSNFATTPVNISPFSPVYSPYNDGSGAGNAQLYYLISVSNVTGDGLTFLNGDLVDIDVDADMKINGVVAPFSSFGSLEYDGSFSIDGSDYLFDVSGTDTLAFFSNTNLIANRAGTALLVPEPATAMALVTLGGLALRRRVATR